MFTTFNLSLFAEEDDTTINNEDKMRKMLKFTQFCN